MGTDLVVSGRAQLAGYAGLAGAMRGRGRRFAVIAGVDVLAVALAFGAMHITGAMMGGDSPMSDLIPPVSAATEPVGATTPLVPQPRLAPKPRVFAAMPDAAVIFAEPVAIARGFTLAVDSPSSSSFTPPPQTVASAGPAPEPTPVQMPTPRLRPAERVAQYDAGDGSLDRLLLRDVVPSVSTGVANAATSTVDGVTSTVGGVPSTVAGFASAVSTVTSIAPPVQTLAQSVTAPVSQVVGSVVGLLN